MRKSTILTVGRAISVTVIVLALLFFFADPVVGATVPSPLPGGRPPIHYAESLSCYLQGGFPRGVLGAYSVQGQLNFGCYPVYF